MTASTILSAVRNPLKTALSSVSANVYDHVPEAVMPPIVCILSADPYLQFDLIGRATIRAKVNLLIKIGVAYMSDAAAIDNLEQLTLAVVALIPTGYEVGDINAPAPYDVGATKLLMLEIPVSTYYTQTA